MATTSQLFSLAGWFMLGRVVTYAQTTLYTIFIRAGTPHPPPGSPRFIRDRKRIFIAAILLYLAYSIYEADYQLQLAGNVYQPLGVPVDVTEKAMKTRWRRIAAQLHPDKGGDELQYVRLQAAHDAIANPDKRFAYDRFGPDVLQWQNCKIKSDYIYTGLQQIMNYYLSGVGVLLIISWLGFFKSGTFWRFYIIAAVCVYEIYSATRPDFPPLLTKVINPLVLSTGIRPGYLPFQIVTLLRKSSFAVTVAMNQLGPFFEDAAAVKPGSEQQQLDQVEMLTKAADGELTHLLNLEAMPFATDRASIDQLRVGVRDWVVENTVQTDAEVRRVRSEVMARRREGVIAGSGGGDA